MKHRVESPSSLQYHHDLVNIPVFLTSGGLCLAQINVLHNTTKGAICTMREEEKTIFRGRELILTSSIIVLPTVALNNDDCKKYLGIESMNTPTHRNDDDSMTRSVLPPSCASISPPALAEPAKV